VVGRTAGPESPADPIRLLTEVADQAGLDAGRVRQRLFARCVEEILGDGVPWAGPDVVLSRLGVVRSRVRSSGGVVQDAVVSLT
jgi:hypothetical protein